VGFAWALGGASDWLRTAVTAATASKVRSVFLKIM
jgi:hypothetical protein